jgi:anti-sigma factor RsiW
MSPRHIEPALLQDHLDGLTDGERAIEIEAHLATCEHCAHEVAQLRHLFFVLERMPLDEPPLGLTERILAGVMPKPRRRWAAAIGWGYAASLAVTIAGVVGIASNPATRTLVSTVFQWMSRSAVQLSVFALDGMSAMVLTLAQSWRWMATAGDHITPLTRAAAALVTNPMISTALAGALATCIVVMWWMHTRERPSSRRSDHVALVGF